MPYHGQIIDTAAADIAFFFSKFLIDLPAAALTGLAMPAPIPEPSESDHRSSKFALGLAVVIFEIVVLAVMGNVKVHWTDVGFRGAAPNKLGAGAGAAAAETIIACAGGLLGVEDPNMAGATYAEFTTVTRPIARVLS